WLPSGRLPAGARAGQAVPSPRSALRPPSLPRPAPRSAPAVASPASPHPLEATAATAVSPPILGRQRPPRPSTQTSSPSCPPSPPTKSVAAHPSSVPFLDNLLRHGLSHILDPRYAIQSLSPTRTKAAQ